MDEEPSITESTPNLVFSPKIATALVKLQADVRAMGKTAKNEHFKNTYAPLDEVMDTALPLLTKNKLSITSWPITIDRKHYLRVVLLHESGENTSTDIELLIVKQDPQALGSAITYTRRQTTMAILGLSAKDEDDDGNKSADRQPLPTEEQIEQIRMLCMDLGYNQDDAAIRIRAIRSQNHAVVAIQKLERIMTQKAHDIRTSKALAVETEEPEAEYDDNANVNVKSVTARLKKLGLRDNTTVREFIRTITGKPFLKNCKQEELEELSKAIDAVLSHKRKLPHEWYPSEGESVTIEDEEVSTKEATPQGNN